MIAAHRDPLALAAGELRRLAFEEALEAEQRRHVVHTTSDLPLRRAADAEPEAEVLAHAHVRIERIVLEHHRNVALGWRQRGDVHIPIEIVPSVILEPAIIRSSVDLPQPDGPTRP